MALPTSTSFHQYFPYHSILHRWPDHSRVHLSFHSLWSSFIIHHTWTCSNLIKHVSSPLFNTPHSSGLLTLSTENPQPSFLFQLQPLHPLLCLYPLHLLHHKSLPTLPLPHAVWLLSQQHFVAVTDLRQVTSSTQDLAHLFAPSKYVIHSCDSHI